MNNINVHEQGLTLLELIISMFIMGLIMVVMTASLRLAFRSVEKGDSAMDSLERMRAATRIINAQIQSTIPVSKDEDNDFEDDAGDDEDDVFKGFDEEEVISLDAMSGDEKSLHFSSALSIWGHTWGGVIVTYETDQDEENMTFLRVTEKNPYTEKTKQTVLLDKMDEIEFNFSYIDDLDIEGETQWTGKWNKESSLEEESRVLQEVGLRLKKGEKEMTYIIPVRIAEGQDNE